MAVTSDRADAARFDAARFDAALDAVGLTGPFRRDCTLAVLLAAVTAGIVLLIPVLEPAVAPEQLPSTAVLLVVVVQTLLLAARRVAPQLCLLAVTGLQVVVPFLALPEDMVRGPATTVAVYTCATLLAPGRVAALTAGVVALETAGVAGALLPGPGLPIGVLVAQLVGVALLYPGAALVGSYVATRRHYTAVLRARAAEEIEAHRARADAAVVRERTRMARELHDIAAHHLSAMVVQTAMIEKLVDRDPERAKQTAADARRQGRETLRDLRMVVGALREDVAGDLTADHPVPGLADLDRLIGTHRGLGAAVTVERTGGPTGLSPVADVTGYRVVQEALANAREHAPGAPVRLAVDRTSDTVTITVQNPLPDGVVDPDRSGRGFGLAGMRERAQLVGADFEFGPTADGNWRVRLVVRGEDDETGTT
ncbi:histidine kinase [Pseudonocardia nematodicida]|uniref:histidine kinase n=1 Tax=Pseudonocardia nematodicida TaxID=1206997 RepID=A0ABV1K5C9_9PSEU